MIWDEIKKKTTSRSNYNISTYFMHFSFQYVTCSFKVKWTEKTIAVSILNYMDHRNITATGVIHVYIYRYLPSFEAGTALHGTFYFEQLIKGLNK